MSILSIPQIMHFDFFLCGTIRHNQDEPEWIVAQRLLSALTIPEVLSRLQKNYHSSSAFIIDHTSISLTKRNSHVTEAKA